MPTRRRFLEQSALGMLALASGCTPPSIIRAPGVPMAPHGNAGLAAKARWAPLRNRLLGYPVNMMLPPEEFFAWRQQLQSVGIGRFAYNNVGNPFRYGPVRYNTHDLEREVIERFAGLYGFPAGDVWGFVSNSGTDSNLHGMYIGRTLLKARTGLMPKAFFTDEGHYSIQILQDVLGVERVTVSTLPDGSMDPEDLRAKLAVHAGFPALVVATTGTTFKGAIDGLDRIRAVLAGRPSYLHLDAALFGGYLPYTPYADEVRYRSSSARAPRYESLAVSCHKFFGFPAPAGLFMTTAATFEEFNGYFRRIHNPAYIRQVPGTITCSRDSVKPAEFHFFTTDRARALLTENAGAILRRADWLFEQMQTHLPHYQPVRASARSNTIYFKQPGEAVVAKYSLATMELDEPEPARGFAHVVVMPHADRNVLTEFLSDLQADRHVPA